MSKNKRQKSDRDSGLNIDRRGSDASDTEDFNRARVTRAQNNQKMRTKGNL